MRRQFGEIDHACLARRRSIPDFARANPHARGRGGQVLEFGARADDDIFLNNTGRSDIGVRSDLDRPEDEVRALDARVAELGFRAKARALANGDEIVRANLDLADQRVIAHLRAQRVQVEPHDRRALKPFHMGQREEVLHEPPAEIIDAPERIAPRLDAPEHQPLDRDAKEDRHQVDAGVNAEQRGGFLKHARGGVRQQHIADEHAEPLRGHHRQDDEQRAGLREAAEKAPRQRRRRERQVARRHDARAAAIQHLGHRA